MMYKQIPKELEEFYNCVIEEFYNCVIEDIDKEIENWKEKEDVAFGLEIAKAIVKGYYEGLKKAYGV